MRISELIKVLEDTQAEHGDLYIVDEYEARVMPFMDMDGVETPKNMDELLAMASRMSEEDEAHFMAGVICTWNLCIRPPKTPRSICKTVVCCLILMVKKI